MNGHHSEVSATAEMTWAQEEADFDENGFAKADPPLNGHSTTEEAQHRVVVDDRELKDMQKKYGYFFAPDELAELKDAFIKLLSKSQDGGEENKGPNTTIVVDDARELLSGLGFIPRDCNIEETMQRIISTRQITVTVVQAESLAARDKNGKSDPFAEVHFGNRVLKTKVCTETLDPVWDETMTLEDDSANPCNTLDLVLWDHDFSVLGNAKDFLGYCTVNLEGSEYEEVTDKWYYLEHSNTYTKKQELVSGRVRLKVFVDKHSSDGKEMDEMRLTFADLVKIVFRERNEGAQTQPTRNPIFPFDPDSMSKQTWDLIVMFLLLYTTFAVPLLLAFGSDPIKGPMTPYQVWDLCLDIIFCTDVVLSFCTAYTHQGVYTTNMWLIARNYLHGWFWIDLPGSVPFDKIVAAASTGDNLAPTLRVLKFIRILKMMRAVRFLNKLSQLEEKDRSGSLRTVLKIFRSIFLMVFSAHFLGCMFVMMIDPKSPNNWMRAYNPEIADHGSDIEQYVLCLYWALATVSTLGYGDVLPVTHDERIYSVFVALTGVVIFGFAMGNITTLLSQAQGSRLRFEDKLRTVSEYLDFRLARPDLKRRITAYFGGCWRRSGELFTEMELLQTFPRQLRRMTLKHLGSEAEKKIPLLFNLDPEVIGEIYVRLQPMVYRRADSIYLRGEEGGEMYFITEGMVNLHGMRLDEYVNESSESIYSSEAFMRLRTAEKGGQEAFFGEMTLFPEVCRYHAEDATANTDVSCFILTYSNVLELKDMFPPFHDKLFQFCSLRAARFGINNNVTKKLAQRSERGFGTMDRLLTEMKNDLLDRHELLMSQSDDRESEKKKSQKLESANATSEDSRMMVWLVKKKLNLIESGYRRIVLDLTAGSLSEDENVETDENGNTVPSKKHTYSSKSIPITSVTGLENVWGKNAALKIHLSSAQSSLDVEFNSALDKEDFVSQVRKQQESILRSAQGIKRTPSASKTKEALQVHRGWLLYHDDKPLGVLKQEHDDFGQWNKVSFVLNNKGMFLYVFDNLASLTHNSYSVLGQLDANSFFQPSIINIGMSNGFSYGKSGCVLPLTSPAIGKTRIIIGMQSAEDVIFIKKKADSLLAEMRRRAQSSQREDKVELSGDQLVGSIDHTRCEQIFKTLSELNMSYHMQKFHDHNIDDEAFFLMSRSDILSRLQIPMGDALKIWSSMQTSSKSKNSGAEDNSEVDMGKFLSELRQMRWEVHQLRKEIGHQ